MPEFDIDTALVPEMHTLTWRILVDDAMHMTPARGLSLAEHLTDLSAEQDGFTDEIRNSAWSASVDVEVTSEAEVVFLITVTQGEPL